MSVIFRFRPKKYLKFKLKNYKLSSMVILLTVFLHVLSTDKKVSSHKTKSRLIITNLTNPNVRMFKIF